MSRGCELAAPAASTCDCNAAMASPRESSGFGAGATGGGMATGGVTTGVLTCAAEGCCTVFLRRKRASTRPPSTPATNSKRYAISDPQVFRVLGAHYDGLAAE